MSKLLFCSALLYHKHKMNPQQPGGPVPPQNSNPQPGSAPQPPVINVPGQDPYTVSPGQSIGPNQQPAVEHSPYEFILSPQQAPKPSKLAGNSVTQRVIIFVGGLTALVIITVIAASIFGGSDQLTTPLVTVMEEQTELARIAGIGASTSGNVTTQGFAYSVQLSMLSAQQQVQAYMKSTHRKFDVKALGAKRSTAADTQLQNAEDNNTYSTTLVSILQNDLQSYTQALVAANKAHPGPNAHKLLSEEYTGAQLLLQQSKQQ